MPSETMGRVLVNCHPHWWHLELGISLILKANLCLRRLLFATLEAMKFVQHQSNLSFWPWGVSSGQCPLAAGRWQLWSSTWPDNTFFYKVPLITPTSSSEVRIYQTWIESIWTNFQSNECISPYTDPWLFSCTKTGALIRIWSVEHFRELTQPRMKLDQDFFFFFSQMGFGIGKIHYSSQLLFFLPVFILIASGKAGNDLGGANNQVWLFAYFSCSAW